MAFYNWLRRRPNLTGRWQGQPDLALVVDLNRHALCGVPIGSPLADLHPLGPSQNRYDHSGIFDYRRRGFELLEHEGRLETAVFYFLPDRRTRPFAGHWQIGERRFTVTAETGPQIIQSYLGEPFHTFTDAADELVWFYEFPGVEWQWNWQADGALASMEMGLPELAYPEAREMYDVTRPWPF